MKIALISDIHGNMPALEAVYNSINSKDIGEIYNLGDSLYGPLWPEETAQFIIGHKIKTILGNGDEDILNQNINNKTIEYSRKELSKNSIEWLKSLEFTYSNNEITLFHGCPDDSRKYLLEKIENNYIKIKDANEISEIIKMINTKYIAFGHSHLERVIKVKDKILINAGSVGLPAYSEDNPKHNIETFNNDAKYVIIDNDEIEICYINYDINISAKRAEKNNRKDWSEYILYGYVM